MTNVLGNIISGTRFENGAPKSAYGTTNSTTFVTILEVASGSGFLTGITAFLAATADQAFIKITIDGVVVDSGTDFFVTTLTGHWSSFGLSFIHRFDSSLEVEACTLNGSAIYMRIAYTLE